MNPDLKNKFVNIKDYEEEDQELCLNFNINAKMTMNNKAVFENDKWTVRKWCIKCI